ncbi:hypothetical protein FNW02_19820 [Komarekiella sp. 'clone 1']|uniref:Uncharacterized protein n=1 Tax=Komarekiella delphini-convector SJRDD-AB1 TaxID=2593771 RepID=A0AA40SZU9_9NOST|nr:hypothetical protein [Komarekiella delphini-convector]MBD6618010.1 hypothetical protein [Komarekiella delphini-convector SJRDD-AB1]
MLVTIFCISFAWGTLIFFILSILFTLKQGISHLKKLHQIPCHACEYFTNDYRLKCTVHPKKACSELAIECIDFEPKTSACNACQKGRRKPC